jgi:hypothetical protein
MLQSKKLKSNQFNLFDFQPAEETQKNQPYQVRDYKKYDTCSNDK